MSKLLMAYLKAAMAGDLSPDITKCTGEGCPMKMQCRRFTVKASAIGQAYMAPPEGECEYFLFNREDGGHDV